MANYPSLKWGKLRRILEREPLLYEVVRQKGSHPKLVSRNGYPDLFLAFHEGVEIPPGLVRKILTRDVGLTDEEATALL